MKLRSHISKRNQAVALNALRDQDQPFDLNNREKAQ